MKLRMSVPALCALALMAQENPAGSLKHLTVPTDMRPVLLSAEEIERGADYPSVVHLKGRVEIRTPVCLKPDRNSGWVCEGYTVLRADEADIHEATGEINARGPVKVTHER